ncbi:MAG: HEAT repeat domain-containing protein [Anaerolineae bacterium]|nr:HEAT repeat domain-containing protein [Anaerolineae bacterium]
MFEYDNEEIQSRERPTLEATLEALELGQKGTPSADIFYGLSDLSVSESERLRPVWDGLDVEYRRKIMRRIAELSESDFEFDYNAIGLFALDDADIVVRQAAIDTLWIDESITLMSKLIQMAQRDPSNEVRAAAVSELGRFILLGEYENIPEQDAKRVQQVAIAIWNDRTEDFHVRRRALEAIAHSSHEIVDQAILEAYSSPDHLMRVSAVFAMGRSCNERWAGLVLTEMSSDDAELQFEAARAAGEIGLSKAVKQLGVLAARQDAEIRETAAWALGEIGGDKAVEILTALADRAEEDEDEDFLEIIEDALANAEFFGELPDDFELDDDEFDDA